LDAIPGIGHGRAAILVNWAQDVGAPGELATLARLAAERKAAERAAWLKTPAGQLHLRAKAEAEKARQLAREEEAKARQLVREEEAKARQLAEEEQARQQRLLQGVKQDFLINFILTSFVLLFAPHDLGMMALIASPIASAVVVFFCGILAYGVAFPFQSIVLGRFLFWLLSVIAWIFSLGDM
jgi:cation transport ATPase